MNGLTTWESSSFILHQSAVQRIIGALHPSNYGTYRCGCLAYADVDIRFPDGSRKRPDISIFCTEPTERESSVTQIPDAVIAIISKDYEAKDRLTGLPFYLSQKIRDIVLFDPYSGESTHYADGVDHLLVSPAAVTLQCGCVRLV
ncbi:MAG: Uma2 family endonuclease [Chthonomonadaceae bacterium]|nr:Uma2 family endonuclease [Chthonomonadaceae bacterium]